MIGLSMTADVYRDSALGTNGRTQKTKLYTAIQCLALPMGHQTTIEHEFALGRGYDVYFSAGTDVKIGDQLVINGNTYDVRFVKAYAVPVVGHTLAVCEEEVA